MARDFDKGDARRKLEAIAKEYGAAINDKGGGLINGCTFDSYFIVGELRKSYAALAIRNPGSDRSAYFAVTKMWSGRKVIDEQVPLSEWSIASDYFRACVQIARLTTNARLIGLIDNRSELWS